MLRYILDTSVLIEHWKRSCGGSIRASRLVDAKEWADMLIKLRKTNAIVTPVYLEVVCGVRSQHELFLTRAYLGQFRVVDEGKILERDWQEARRVAERVPRNAKPRHLGDCLIRAIANRLKYDVDTLDDDFPG